MGAKVPKTATALKRWIMSRNALEKEGALAVIICVFSDAPSQVAQEVIIIILIIIK